MTTFKVGDRVEFDSLGYTFPGTLRQILGKTAYVKTDHDNQVYFIDISKIRPEKSLSSPKFAEWLNLTFPDFVVK